ncbi:MAG: methylated-DNA--[protein]-cysteine S-methyltransferase [Chloroflexota bacterium]
MQVDYASIDSAFGSIWFAAGTRGLVALDVDVEGGAFVGRLLAIGYLPNHAPRELSSFALQLDEYFRGERRRFDVDIDLSRQTPFQTAVLKAITSVPYGEVRSYGEIAELIGRPGAARAVAGALASCPLSIVIPCHRVTRSGVGGDERALFGDPGSARRLSLVRFERKMLRARGNRGTADL